MRTAPVDRTEPLAVAAPLREIFMKSIVASRDLPAGTLLRREDLALKKPGTGLPAARLGDIVGRRLARPLARDALLAPTDLHAATCAAPGTASSSPPVLTFGAPDRTAGATPRTHLRTSR